MLLISQPALQLDLILQIQWNLLLPSYASIRNSDLGYPFAKDPLSVLRLFNMDKRFQHKFSVSPAEYLSQQVY